MLSFVEVLSVAVEVVVYLDVCSVGRLAVVSKETGQMVKEVKFGAERVLYECRRLVWEQRVRVSRQVTGEVCARVVDAAAGARSPVCDLVAHLWRVGGCAEVGLVKKLITEVGNKLTELIRWCMQHCQWGVRGVGVDAQMGSDGLVQMLVWWPRTE